MFNLRRILVMLVLVALPLAGTVTAAAKKPPKEPRPSGGYTCAESGFDQTSHGLTFTETGFTFALEGKEDAMCVDVLHGTADVWRVSVTGRNVSSLLLVPRDSLGPGDSCGGVLLRKPALPLVQELPDPSDPRHELGIPPATVNACGTQYGEWIDGILEMDRTDDPHPLAFQTHMRGRPGTEAIITVELP